MPPKKPVVSVAERLRQAIAASEISYRELGRRAQVDPAQLSRFMALGRDMTLAVASRLCEVLGLELVQTGALGSEPLSEPTPTTRQRFTEGLPPETTYPRGQGKRMDLPPERRGVRDQELEEGATGSGAGPAKVDGLGGTKEGAGERGAKKPARRRRKSEGDTGAGEPQTGK